MEASKKNYKTKSKNLKKLKSYLQKIKKTSNEVNARFSSGSGRK